MQNTEAATRHRMITKLILFWGLMIFGPAGYSSEINKRYEPVLEKAKYRRGWNYCNENHPIKLKKPFLYVLFEGGSLAADKRIKQSRHYLLVPKKNFSTDATLVLKRLASAKNINEEKIEGYYHTGWIKGGQKARIKSKWTTGGSSVFIFQKYNYGSPVKEKYVGLQLGTQSEFYDLSRKKWYPERWGQYANYGLYCDKRHSDQILLRTAFLLVIKEDRDSEKSAGTYFMVSDYIYFPEKLKPLSKPSI